MDSKNSIEEGIFFWSNSLLIKYLEKKLVLDSALENDILLSSERNARISARENDYQARRHGRSLSPSHQVNEGEDCKTEDSTSFSYLQAMKEQKIERERQSIMRQARKIQEQDEKSRMSPEKTNFCSNLNTPSSSTGRSVKRRRWDMPTPNLSSHSEAEEEHYSRSHQKESSNSEWEVSNTPHIGTTNDGYSATPLSNNISRWDSTPLNHENLNMDLAAQKRSRWDATPLRSNGPESSFFNAGTPGSITSSYSLVGSLDFRNRPWSDEDLNSILPSEGYAVLEVPSSYVPIRTPSRKLDATPLAFATPNGFQILPDDPIAARVMLGLSNLSNADSDLPFSKPEDYQYFSKLLTKINDDEMSLEEAKERKILKLLLRIKNGSPSVRRVALRQLTERAREFGAGPLFDQIRVCT